MKMSAHLTPNASDKKMYIATYPPSIVASAAARVKSKKDTRIEGGIRRKRWVYNIREILLNCAVIYHRISHLFGFSLKTFLIFGEKAAARDGNLYKKQFFLCSKNLIYFFANEVKFRNKKFSRPARPTPRIFTHERSPHKILFLIAVEAIEGNCFYIYPSNNTPRVLLFAFISFRFLHYFPSYSSRCSKIYCFVRLWFFFVLSMSSFD